MLDLESKINLINHRLKMSEEKLESSKLLLEAKNYRDSISRSYYSIFSAIRAVLALNGTDFRKPSAIIQEYLIINILTLLELRLTLEARAIMMNFLSFSNQMPRNNIITLKNF